MSAPKKNAKALSKAVRFEVLKRDKFACQYCGAKAPEVLLHVDHIHPRAKGGANDLMNLIASCQPCNSGKSDRTLADDSVVQKRRAQVDEVAARREQIEMMGAWQMSLVDLDAQQFQIVASLIARLIPGWMLSEHSRSQTRRHIAKYGLDAVCAEWRRASTMAVLVDGKATADSSRIAFRSALSTLDYKAQNDADPLGSQARYIRGILRRRLYARWNPATLEQITSALRLGASFQLLKDAACNIPNWAEWDGHIERVIEDLS